METDGNDGGILIFIQRMVPINLHCRSIHGTDGNRRQ
jgi:hypothetical protein